MSANKHTLRCLTTVLITTLFGCAGPAPSDPFGTLDRSAQYETTGTTQEGFFEAEVSSGFATENERNFSVTLHYGLDERTEGFVESLLHAHLRQAGRDAHGAGDMQLGLLHRFLEVDEGWNLAGRLALELPTGDRNEDLGTGEPALHLGWIAERDVGRYTLTGSYGLSSAGTSGPGGPDVEHSLSLTAATTLLARVAAFAGWDGSYAPEGSEESSARLGVAFSPTSMSILDLVWSTGLDRDAPDSQLSLGFTLQW